MINYNDTHCTGCSACVHICPVDAISMQYNTEGFLYPFVNNDKCIKCDKCSEVCQINGVTRFKAPTVCYAAWSNDEKIRLNSSSGALFYELSRYIIAHSGIVCGAAFVDDFKVQHIFIDKENDLYKLQGSKYVQSDLNNCFIKIKNFLINGKIILFSGTGCQIAGLKKFLNKEYNNLITVDIVCHGVPSPGVFKNYINELKEKYGDFDRITFRDKNQGWNWDFYFTIYRRDKIIFREVVGNNIFLTAFLRHYILRPSCHTCNFATVERCSDITLADFWNIKRTYIDLDDSKGTSLLLIHSVKGQKIIDNIQNNLGKFKELDIKFAFQSNANLIRPSPAHAHRQKFFDNYAKTKKVIDWFDKEFNTIGILNFHYANNIGAVLVAYSLTKVINDMGYTAEIINFRPSGKLENNKFEEFRTKYIPQSKIYSSITDLDKTKYRRIIVGSDQIWKLGNTELFMLGWASGYRSFIAYAASFGDSQYVGNINKDYAEQLLKRFDSISVREDSGVNICNSTFKINAKHVLDPTFLINVSDYIKIINDDKSISKINKKYIFVACYSNENNGILNNDKTLLNDFIKYQVIDLWKLNNPSIGKILSLIKDADYIITDSFHITVFSIIFNKQFVSLVPHGFNGQERIPSLLYNLGLKKRIFENISYINKNSFIENIDYTVINKIIDRKRARSLLFLRESLKKNIVFKAHIDNKHNEFWRTFVDKKKDIIPCFLKPMSKYNNNYFMFFINGLEGSIHYEITKPINGIMKIALHFEDKNIILNNRKINLINKLAMKLKDFGFEYVQSSSMSGIRKLINVDDFNIEFNNLVYNSYFSLFIIMEVIPNKEILFFKSYLNSIV